MFSSYLGSEGEKEGKNMNNYWKKTFEMLKGFKGDNLEVINSIIARDDAEEHLYCELKRCIEVFLNTSHKKQNSQHIPHVAVMLAHLDSERSSPYLLELIKLDLDYYHYFFDEINTECLHFICYKLGKNNLGELFKLLNDESIYEWGRHYVAEGLFMLCQTNPEIKNIILPEFKSLFNSSTMNFHIIRGVLKYKINELHKDALEAFNKPKIDPMDLSLDEVNALKDGGFENNGVKTLDDLYEVLAEYEKEGQEYAHELEEWDFF